MSDNFYKQKPNVKLQLSIEINLDNYSPGCLQQDNLTSNVSPTGCFILPDSWFLSLSVPKYQFQPHYLSCQSVSANQRPVSRSRDHSQPIRGEDPGHVTTLSQSEAGVLIIFLVSHSRQWLTALTAPGHRSPGSMLASDWSQLDNAGLWLADTRPLCLLDNEVRLSSEKRKV